MPKHSSNQNTGIDEFESKSAVADNPIGLTEAFKPVTESFEPVQVEDEAPVVGAHAAVADGADSNDSFTFNESTSSDSSAAQFAEAEEEPVVDEDYAFASQQFAFDKKAAKKREKELAKAAKKAGKVQFTKKGRRVRTALIITVILLIALLIAAGVGVYMLMQEVQHVAVQQTVEQQEQLSEDSDAGNDTKDTTTDTTKKTEVPGLTGLLGKTQDEAVAELAHGATVTSSRSVNEEGNDIKTSVTVALTDEPADSKSGTPTVYLGLNEAGQIIEAGYSAATASLGYGSLSFVDAVTNEHIVEKTLQEAGVGVAEGTVSLPESKTEYSTYASDGTTLTRESYTFTGTANVNGADRQWSSVLMYDYTTANASGNLADTIRMIYVYVNE